jgi:predicted TIM-barrel fold metal-dependent hydrolase
MRIDVDAHIDETEATWEYMAEGESRFRPLSVDPGVPPASNDARPHRLWLTERPGTSGATEGRVGLRRWRDDRRTGTTQITRELIDVDARVRHMDELRIDVQVIYPTYLLGGVATERPEVEIAMTRSYNRWMAAETAKSHGRLRWVAIPPLLDIDKAVEEIRWARDHGACGVMMKTRGEIGKRDASDPYFFPLYQEASQLDMPVCWHGGRAPTSFTELVQDGTPEQFPALRFGWIETSASWIPYLHADLVAKNRLRTFRPIDLKEDLFRRYRLYVSCHTVDDLPYILQFGTEDNLLIGTDYGHADQYGEIEALDIIEQRGQQGIIPVAVVKKILDDNPRRFYGL